MDTSTLGTFAARMMEQLAEDFTDEDTAFVRSFALVVEIDTGPETFIQVAASDDRGWAQLGLLKEARKVLKRSVAESELED